MNLEKIKTITPNIIFIKSHPGIIQSILDYDFICNKTKPSIKAIWANGRKNERYFFGEKEILIPVYKTLEDIPLQIKNNINLFVNVSSGRRTLSTTIEIINKLPNIIAGTLFAEEVPEKHAREIAFELERFKNKHNKEIMIFGPSSIGLILPSHLKLGPIGGITAKQMINEQLYKSGNFAIFSASGGMTNEIINILAQNQKFLSFAFSFGGDRFPIITPKQALLMAQQDKDTTTIVYYGELGGYDEYEFIELIKSQKITKKIIAHISGTISEMFETPPQFGHAKAMAQNLDESASAKRKALKNAGVHIADSFDHFIELIKDTKNLNKDQNSDKSINLDQNIFINRKKKLFFSSVSRETKGKVQIFQKDLTKFTINNSFGYVVGSILLNKELKSPDTANFIELIFKLLVDHGPYQSGAINTMITARAGKDLVSSLASGILTIGDRFGGAINNAAKNWFYQTNAKKFVEEYAKQKKYIPGIGHKKYSINTPDPRVKTIFDFIDQNKNIQIKKYSNFAQEVASITTQKKANLILNVDGTIAAVFLDILKELENFSLQEIQTLIDIEFFNSFFILSRSIGFTAHFFDQKRLDEGLFRLTPNEIAS